MMPYTNPPTPNPSPRGGRGTGLRKNGGARSSFDEIPMLEVADIATACRKIEAVRGVSLSAERGP